MKKVYMNYALDAVIALAFVVSAVSGLAFVFMGDNGYQGGRNASFATALWGIPRASWSDLHLLSSLVMMAGVLIHLVLHWKWITCVSKQLIPELPRKKQEACEVIS